MFVESGDSFSFFLPPYVVFGRGKRATIPDYANRLGLKKVLLVVDPFFAGTKYLPELQKGLNDVGIESTVWSGVVPDPTDVSVDDAAGVYKNAGCHGVICIGGGSAMDTGKSVGILIASGAKSIREHLPPTYRSVNGMAPVICVPTTGGTGAEVNPYAIVTNTETHKKGLAYAGWELLAAQRVAVVDPDLTASMPPTLTAITGVDALCHALECYITGAPLGAPNPISDDLALRAIHLVATNLRRAVFDGQDMKARTNMSLAAMLATMAFPNAGLTHCHCLNEVLVESFGISHGEAVGSVLVATLEVFLPFRTERLAEVAQSFGVPTAGKSQRETAEAGIGEIRQLMREVGFPSLSEAVRGKKVDIDALMQDFLGRYPQFNPPNQAKRIRYTLERSLEL